MFMKKDLFFELIRVALGKQELLSMTPSAQEWEELFALAKEQTLYGICFSGIERLPAEQKPDTDLLMQWWGIVRRIEERNALMDVRTMEAVKHFRHAGFRANVLKGQGIAQLYPKPERRQSGDVDVWVVPNEKETRGAREVIYEFARKHDPEGKLHGLNYHHIHYHLFEDAEVELHIYPSFMQNPFTNARLHEFCRLYLPNDEKMPPLAFNRVFILLHCFDHFLGHGVGLRQVMDYYYVLRSEACRKENGDLTVAASETVKWVKALGLLRFAGAMMWVLREVFRLEEEFMFVEPDEKEGRFLLEEICLTGNMGHHDKRFWGSVRTPVSRFFYNLHRDFHFLAHYPKEVLWQPLFSIWMNVWRVRWTGRIGARVSEE